MAKKEIFLIVVVTVFSFIHLSFAEQQTPLRTAPAQKAPIQLAPKQIAPQAKPGSPLQVLKNQVQISSSDFEGFVSQLFSGAYFQIGGVGWVPGPWSVLHVNANYHKAEPLDILNADLPPSVKQQTTREEISYAKNPPIVRDGAIRAWINNQGTYPWKGFVENGKLKIRMQFQSSVFIKTSKMEGKKTRSGWEKNYEWDDFLADHNVPDYFYVALCLDVYLTPVVQNGLLSYGNVVVNWYWQEDKGFVWPKGALVSDPFAIPYGHPVEKEMILQYKTDVMNTIKQRPANAFNDSVVRDLITAGLTSKVKSGNFSNRTIESVLARKNDIIVQFK